MTGDATCDRGWRREIRPWPKTRPWLETRPCPSLLTLVKVTRDATMAKGGDTK
ncbi:hypothetical protein JHK85_009985 [Glycine max]|uniref:Uncharacterized protein n=1 Tax=Glycine soja TaxID=3848 RepID=A0A0B2QXM8_GLYSO|nr:hypothetical protein JHK87_009595 [Glycine soja]KAG5048882.1 hypothetical protein JHK85_009985 [Glycine max]KHN24749.1 hypothetical protein glysoja_041515 [Glycine soja]